LLTDLDRTLTALADPARRAIVDLLQDTPRCSSALADALSLSRPNMSRHLRVLRKAGVVEEAGLESDARVRVYRLRREPFSELRGWLDEVEAFWGEQLRAFKAHAESHTPRSRQ
jgi:DNA-binding transcriptional ArsR family regulator